MQSNHSRSVIMALDRENTMTIIRRGRMITNTHIINAAEVLCEEGFEAYFQELANYFANNRHNNLTYGEFCNRTARAILPLTCDKEAIFYTVAYAWLHYLTMRKLIEDSVEFTVESDDSLKLRVIDYGCGQGVATIAFIEFLVTNGLSENCEIDLVLIEPSFVSLQIAQYLCARLAKAHGISMVIQIQPCELKNARLPKTNAYNDTIHLMSNVLDIDTVQDALDDLVSDISKIPGNHLLFAASPSYSDTHAGFNKLKQLKPYADIHSEEAIQLWYDQYIITQDRWKKSPAKRDLMMLSWNANDVELAIAC